MKVGKGLLAAALLAAMAVAACSLVVGSDSVQCSTDADCVARGDAFASATCVNQLCVGASEAGTDAPAESASSDASSEAEGSLANDGALDAADGATGGPWACVGQATAPTQDMTRMLSMTAQVRDPNMTPLAGFSVNVCIRSDPTCISPIVGPLTSDSQGKVSFSVPYAAAFVLTATAPGYPDAASGYPKSLVYVDPAPTADGALTITMVSSADLMGLALVAGTPYDATKGLFILSAEDCNFDSAHLASGVHFELTTPGDGSSEVYPYYLVGGSPSTTATETDNDGNGGFVNVPPGFVTVTGTLPGMGDLQMAQTSLVSQPRTITFATLDPYEH
jgi:hypothetical protein